jgi:hypothetical protein
MRTAYLGSNRPLHFDYLFGFRAWGLVLYGALPASLAALGVLKVPEFNARSPGVLLLFLLVSAVPLVVLFMLIRQRLAVWYLFEDHLELRSSILTFANLLLSCLISYSAGLVTGRYKIVSWSDWLGLDANLRWVPILESILIAVITLIGSSTLFLTAIKADDGLPALPSSEFVQDLKSLREKIATIRSESIWRISTSNISQKMSDNIEEAKAIAKRLARRSPALSGRHGFYLELIQDLDSLESVRSQIEVAPTKWSDYFSPGEPAGLNPDERNLRIALARLQEVCINV